MKDDPGPARACVGCGALVPDIDGPTHAYIGASPGCWKIYGDVLARDYGTLRYPAWHRLTVDAYAAQHPGVPSRRSIQSVCMHLIALRLLLVRGLEPAFVTTVLRAAIRIAPGFRWLDPPSFADAPTILAVAAVDDVADLERAIHDWAQGVWDAWAPQHATIEAWASELV